MKRKDVDEVLVKDGFFDFTLSSPALKIRRLDAELAPIIDEQGSSNSQVLEHEQSMLFEDNFVEQPMESSPVAIIDSVPVNEERAIVLFNPKTSLNSRLPLPFSADSEFLSRFKNPVIWTNKSGTSRSLADETKQQDDNSGRSDGCLAVVPWVGSHSSQQHPNAEISSDMMDSDAMDVEDSYNYNTQQMMPKQQSASNSVTQGWNQWQQHCMIQQPLNNNLSTPITWLG